MIYVHVPFCRSFCTYCDFYSEICSGKEREAIDRYVKAICEEALKRKAEIDATRGLNTLYIGGGTPSVLPLSSLECIVSTLRKGPWDEFTMEVNPEDVLEKGVTYARALKDVGVDRVSMGVQSLNDGILRWMNRRHDADGARNAFSILREAGFDNISIDLITGISNLTDEILSSTLDEILDDWRPEHISSYQLSIEEGSALAGMLEDGRYVEASEESCRRQYDMLCHRLSRTGFVHYEISNWALHGHESKHNSAYWRRIPYVGLGPGAHSLKGTDVRSWNSSELCNWTSSGEHLSAEEVREEEIMLGMRTAEGFGGKRIPESEWFVADSIIADMI